MTSFLRSVTAISGSQDHYFVTRYGSCVILWYLKLKSDGINNYRFKLLKIG